MKQLSFFYFSIFASTLLTIQFLFLLSNAKALITLPRNMNIPAVIMFGDSIVDTGNNNNLETLFKVNFPPYGENFMGAKPTGRFSNGKVPSDFFVEELGIKELLEAYLDPKLKPEDLITGVNFASGGAGYDPLTSRIASVISLTDQMDLFKEYITKLKKVAGNERAKAIIGTSLYVVAAGTNDITNTYFSLLKSGYDFPPYADIMVNSASTFMQNLHDLGARRIGVFGVPPIGCLPSQRTLAGGPNRTCAQNHNQAAKVFNKKLSTKLISLNHKLLHSKIVYIDGYNLILDLIQNPHKYGFNIADKGCCGTGVLEVAFLCSFTCGNVSEYVFWDSFHLTERAYRIVVHQILKNQISSFI